MAPKSLPAHPPGTFCWPELATSDLQAAQLFYTSLFGWTVVESQTDAGPYCRFQLDGEDVGAACPATADQGPPHWNSYVAVANVDKTAARVPKLGGTLVAGPFDVFDAGRMAVVKDPAGAFISLWQAKNHIGAARLNDPGTLCWTELATTDTKAAEKFYTALFGWTAKRGTAPPGEYTEFFSLGTAVGGMMPIQAEWGDVPPHWLPYFAVVDCDASAGRVKQNGGTLPLPPNDVPGIGRFAVACDPQGATFAIIALRQAA
jgi:predicted enzyme related to lactoylglutathione lyase